MTLFDGETFHYTKSSSSGVFAEPFDHLHSYNRHDDESALFFFIIASQRDRQSRRFFFFLSRPLNQLSLWTARRCRWICYSNLHFTDFALLTKVLSFSSLTIDASHINSPRNSILLYFTVDTCL